MSIIQYEEYTCLTWPALETESYDGWLLRFSGGVTNRSNAVYPLYHSSYDLDRKLAYCEAAYAARGQRAVYRITGGIHPPGLEARLASEGYVEYEKSIVMTRQADGVDGSSAHSVAIDEDLQERWLDAYLKFQPRWASERETFAAMMRSPAGKRAYASVEVDGQVAAVGTLSRTRGVAAVYNMATDPARRGQGLATSVLRALTHYAVKNGVSSLFLHVSADNTAAVRLYTRAGFVESYRYCYRAAPG